MARSLQSRRDLGNLGAISAISARSRQSRRVLGNLGEMEDISPRSRRDLESNKHHGEISTRSLQSRRDLINLNEILPISVRSCRSRRDLAHLGEISVKILHGLVPFKGVLCILHFLTTLNKFILNCTIYVYKNVVWKILISYLPPNSLSFASSFIS